jgi:aminoglycoside phosphotransferase (APT) family kinase protein
MSEIPDAALEQRVAERMQTRPVAFRPAAGGYTAAKRGIVTFEDGRSAFLKAAVSEETADWLRAEYAVYRYLGAAGADFLPRVLAWDDDGARPILLLEDLSAAHWPPPWEPGHAARVAETLSRLRRVPPMPGMATLEAYRDDFSGWRKVAADPGPFLSVGLCTAAWLDAALPGLQAAEQALRLDGTDFLHLDIRSDNVCFTPERTILVDWNWACTGNGQVDLAAWLPSLHAEGGPAPETFLPHAPEPAAALSGFWAARAGLPDRDPRMRHLNVFQLRTALPWAARAVGLDASGLLKGINT